MSITNEKSATSFSFHLFVVVVVVALVVALIVVAIILQKKHRLYVLSRPFVMM